MIYDPAIWERLFGFLAGLLELSICAVFGAVIGAAYSMWLAYDAQGVVRPDWRRLAVSVICSALFGGFAAALLAEFNIVSMGKILGAEGWLSWVASSGLTLWTRFRRASDWMVSVGPSIASRMT